MSITPKKYIVVTFQKEGIHSFPEAGTNPLYKTGGLDDVSFLALPHRHLFHFTVKISITHSDREIEFIQFKRWLERLYQVGVTLDLNNRSCEMLAEELYEYINGKYPNRYVEISVFEDGENGATLVWDNNAK